MKYKSFTYSSHVFYGFSYRAFYLVPQIMISQIIIFIITSNFQKIICYSLRQSLSKCIYNIILSIYPCGHNDSSRNTVSGQVICYGALFFYIEVIPISFHLSLLFCYHKIHMLVHLHTIFTHQWYPKYS